MFLLLFKYTILSLFIASPLLNDGKDKQMYLIEGAVIDSKTGKSLDGVDVVISGLQNPFLIELKTDEEGMFKVELPSESIFTIICAKRHYFHSDIFQFNTYVDEKILLKIPLKKAVLGESYIIRSIDFEVNSIQLQVKTGKERIDKLITFLKLNRDIILEIGVHSDSRGESIYNLELTSKRGKAVADYIISSGITSNRITYKGYGEEKPLNECIDGVLCSSEKHLQNRRIEFKVISVKAE